MRIAVSDYDGTLKQSGIVLDSDIQAIRDWRARGNLFGLATGRDLGMTLFETDKYDIPFDFLVCMNGCALYDGGKVLLSCTEIAADVAPAIVKHPASAASMHVAIMTEPELQLCFQGDASWFARTELPHRIIDNEQAVSAGNVVQISLGYKTVPEAAEWARRLNMDFAGKAVAHHNNVSIDINPAGTDKAVGIKTLAAMHGWNTDDIMVIGDGGNDIGMVKAFHGCTLHHGLDELKKAAKNVFSNLGEMLAM